MARRKPAAGARKTPRAEEDESTYDFWFDGPEDFRKNPRCAYKACPIGTVEGVRWMKVTDGTMAGGKDWSRYQGRSFCKQCFNYFANNGTFF